MKILVTGGAGFIGSHLVDELLRRGYHVVVVDNFATGHRRNLARHYSPKLTVVAHDIRNTRGLNSHFTGVDHVYHLAALADIIPSIVDPMAYFTTNVVGTANVLQSARAARVLRFVYVASSSCYGIPDVYPTPETAVIRCEYPYALTKYLGEQTVLHWQKVYGVPANSVRFFNIYGPRARTSGTYGAVFGVFLAQKLHNQPLTIVGTGEQTRDFTYVTDAVAAMLAVAESQVVGEIFNVGSGGTYSINEVAALLGGATTHIPKRPGEPDATFADITKIKRELGWAPRVSLTEGVSRLLQHHSDWQDAPVWTPQKIAVATRDWFQYLQR